MDACTTDAAALRPSPRHHLGLLAQLRQRCRDPKPARHDLRRLRRRHHPLRSRQQLRAALRRSCRKILKNLPRDEILVTTKAGLTCGRPLQRVGTQVPPSQPRPVPQAARPRLRGPLLLPPLRPRHPLDETLGALDTAVRQGKAYVGISSYLPDQTRSRPNRSGQRFRPLAIHQPNYSMLNRWPENGLLGACSEARPRRHRLLSSFPRPAHRQVSRRHSLSLSPSLDNSPSGGRTANKTSPLFANLMHTPANAANPRPNGPLGSSRRACHLRPHRR